MRIPKRENYDTSLNLSKVNYKRSNIIEIFFSIQNYKKSTDPSTEILRRGMASIYFIRFLMTDSSGMLSRFEGKIIVARWMVS